MDKKSQEKKLKRKIENRDEKVEKTEKSVKVAKLLHEDSVKRKYLQNDSNSQTTEKPKKKSRNRKHDEEPVNRYIPKKERVQRQEEAKKKRIEGLGTIENAKIVKVDLLSGVTLEFENKNISSLPAFASLMDIGDDVEDNPISSMVGKENKIVECVLLRGRKHHVCVSLNPSVIERARLDDKKFLELPPVGLIVNGYILRKCYKHFNVTLQNGFVGQLSFEHLTHKPDSFVYVESLKPGALIEAKIISTSDSVIELDCRSRTLFPLLKYDDLEVGTIVEGSVLNMKVNGAYIALFNFDKTTCKSVQIKWFEVSDEVKKMEDLADVLKKGDKVKGQIVDKDDSKGIIFLSLKVDQSVEAANKVPEHFLNNYVKIYQQQMKEEALTKPAKLEITETQDENKENSENSEDSKKDEDEDDEGPIIGRTRRTAFSTTQVPNEDKENLTKFSKSELNNLNNSDNSENTENSENSEDSNESNESNSDDSNESEQGMQVENSKKNLSKEDMSKVVEEHEKNVLENPNSSYLWIQYMAFWIGMMQIEKAREVFKLSLSKIDQNLQTERLNMWVARMNMENSFGTEGTCEEVFSDALVFNNKLDVYNAAAKMFAKSKNPEKAKVVHQTIVKKFAKEYNSWVNYFTFLFKEGEFKEAQDQLAKAFIHLQKSNHVLLIVKFACLEYTYGDKGKGQTMFENLLATYPKKFDVWITYADQEKKVGNVDKVRQIYDRATSIKCGAKQMKFLLQKFLQFEQDFGNELTIEHVKQKAMDYVKKS